MVQDPNKVMISGKVRSLSAFHIGTGYGLAGVLDRKTVRGGDRFIYIPGSSLKGRVKMFYQQVASRLGKEGCWQRGAPCDPPALCCSCRAFGSPKVEGPLAFSDARLDEILRKDIQSLDEEHYDRRYLPLFETEVRANVMLSRLRRTARRAHLFTTELGRPGLELDFFIAGWLPPSETLGSQAIPLEVALLVAALRMMDQLGGGKSRGSGRCVILFPEKGIQVGNQELTEEEVLSSLEGGC